MGWWWMLNAYPISCDLPVVLCLSINDVIISSRLIRGDFNCMHSEQPSCRAARLLLLPVSMFSILIQPRFSRKASFRLIWRKRKAYIRLPHHFQFNIIAMNCARAHVCGCVDVGVCLLARMNVNVELRCVWFILSQFVIVIVSTELSCTLTHRIILEGGVERVTSALSID